MPLPDRFPSAIFDPRLKQPNFDLPRIAVLPLRPNFPRLRSVVQNNGVSGTLLYAVVQSRMRSYAEVENSMH